jgi:hypothetical protein
MKEMKKMGLLGLLAMLALSGCVSSNLTQLTEALGKDTNSVRVVVTTIYGNVTVERNIPYRATMAP